VPTLDSTPTPGLLPPHDSHGIEYGKNYPQRNLPRDFPQIRNKASRIFDSVGGDLRDDAPPVLDPLAYKWEPRAPPPNTFPHCRSSHQTEPSAPCQFEACRAKPSPEGGSSSRSAAAGANSTAGAPPEDTPTAIEDRPSRLCIASFPPSVSATVSDQNEFLSTSRLRRSLRIGK
jgi:hypothetical protein